MRRALETFYAFGIALIALVFFTARAVWDWMPRIDPGTAHLMPGGGASGVTYLPAQRAQFKAFADRMARRQQAGFAAWRTPSMA